MITWTTTTENINQEDHALVASGILDTSREVYFQGELVDLATPPAEYFSMEPSSSEVYSVVVESANSETPWRVHGFLAPEKSSHTGFQGRRIQYPKDESGYKYFHTSSTICADGQRISTGNLIVGVGHADVRMPGDQARKWYQTAAQLTEGSAGIVADVRAIEIDGMGIFVTGALRPEATPNQIRALNSSNASGDWRTFFNEAGRKIKQLIAAVSVGLPGFSTPGIDNALVASGFTLDQIEASKEHAGVQVFYNDGDIETLIMGLENKSPETLRIEALESQVEDLVSYISKLKIQDTFKEL